MFEAVTLRHLGDSSEGGCDPRRCVRYESLRRRPVRPQSGPDSVGAVEMGQGVKDRCRPGWEKKV
eukprot:1395517-Amorphochlora_amoeboformis.AAC.3